MARCPAAVYNKIANTACLGLPAKNLPGRRSGKPPRRNGRPAKNPEENNMQIQLLGTAAYERVPALFCNCPACKAAAAAGGKNVRTQTQALIDGRLLIDFGADNYPHFLQAGADFSAVRTLLLTHSHSDHLNADDFTMRSVPYAHGLTFSPLFGNAECGRRLPAGKAQYGIEYTEMRAYETAERDGYTFTALPANHPTKNPYTYILSDGHSTLYYCLDTGLPAKEVYDFIAGKKFRFDAVICDCTACLQPLRDAGGHMSLLGNLAHREALQKAGAADAGTKWVVTHFSHNGLVKDGRGILHTELEELCRRCGMTASYDGFTLEI
mgnify:CR=1 FL=1